MYLKVLSTLFRAQVITLSTFPPLTGSQESVLCPARALRTYIERSASYRKSEQLFVVFGDRAKGDPVTKQRISRWLVDAVTLAYASSGLQCPIRVRAHSTSGIASSWAWSSGVHFTMKNWSSGVHKCPFQTFVRRLAGPRHPHLQGFTGCPRLAAQSPFCLSSNLSGSLDQQCSSPSLLGLYGCQVSLRDDTKATDDSQGSPCPWCILLTPLGLIPCESWFWNRSTT